MCQRRVDNRDKRKRDARNEMGELIEIKIKEKGAPKHNVGIELA